MSNLAHTPLESLADAESVIEIRSYDEMLARVLFRAGFDVKAVKPAKIIGWYRLDPKIVCGKSDCHQEHGLGYLIVRSDGLEGNIGNRCGEKHFGADFKILRNQFESKRRIKSYRDRLSSAKGALSEVWRRLSDLKRQNFGASWVYTTCETFRLGCPPELFSLLRGMAQRGETQVFRERRLSESERELRNAISGTRSDNDEDENGNTKKSTGPQYVREGAGVLQGMEVWRQDLRKIVIENIERRAQEFEGLNIFNLSEPKLLVWVRWYESLEAEFSAAESIINDAIKFFSDENIQVVLKIQTSEITSSKTRKLKWDANKFRWKR